MCKDELIKNNLYDIIKRKTKVWNNMILLVLFIFFKEGIERNTFRGACLCPKSLQSCPTLCNFVDCSLPGSSVHGILQARILEWVAMPSSRGSSQPRDQARVSCISYIDRQVLYHQCHLGSPTSIGESKIFRRIPKMANRIILEGQGGGVVRGKKNQSTQQLSFYKVIFCLKYLLYEYISFMLKKEKFKKSLWFCSSILARKFHGQRSLAGYSPWDHKESDMTEHTHTHMVLLSPPD